MDLQTLIDEIDKLSPEEFRTLAQHVAQRRTAHLSARELLKLLPDERERLVAEAIQASAEENFEIFEAFDEDE